MVAETRDSTIYTAELESVDLARFKRFWNRATASLAPRLEAKQAGDGDEYGVAWYIYGYGHALGWLDARAPRADRLKVRLLLADDDEAIPPGEPDDPDPWRDRLLVDWIVEFVRGWVRHHFDAALTTEGRESVSPKQDESFTPNDSGSDTDILGLTTRQSEVANLFAAGDSYAEIAKVLIISEQTVRSHMEKVREGLKGHAELDEVLHEATTRRLLRQRGYGIGSR